jgi:hypothetical protein
VSSSLSKKNIVASKNLDVVFKRINIFFLNLQILLITIEKEKQTQGMLDQPKLQGLKD